MIKLIAVLVAPLLLSSCLAGAAIGVTGAVVGGAVKTTGAVIGAVIPDGHHDDDKDKHHH